MTDKYPKKRTVLWLYLSIFVLVSGATSKPLQAQVIDTVQLPNGNSLPPPQDVQPPTPSPLPSPELPQPLPPPAELFPPSTPTPTPEEPLPGNFPQTIIVERFEVVGSTVFSAEELAKATAEFTKRPISITEVYQASSKITDLYVQNGYITSGAYIPPQTIQSGVIKIQVVEGKLEDIKITGTRRINPSYIRGRLSVATSQALNRERLLEALQQLQLNPLIESLSAELSAGSRTGLSLLEIKINERSFMAQNRSEQSTSSNSSFVITGRGGLPSSPTDVLTTNAILIDRIDLHSDSLLEQSKVLYSTGNFAKAVEVLQQAVQIYKQQGESLKLAATLSNLSLAYQQLGAWSQAQQAITESLNLLKGQDKNQNLQLFAQSLDIQGRLQLAMGQSEAALATWQQTEEIYKQTDNKTGVVRSLINQAQAWQTQGFYTRSVKTLDQVSQTLKSQPDSIEKTVSLRSLGDALLVLGDLKKSHQALEESLMIAQNLQSSADIAASLFSLGNNARKQDQTPEAIAYYQQTVEVSPSPLTKVQAQLNLLGLLIEDRQWAKVQTLLPLIESQLDQLPLSRASIYAQVNFSQSLAKVTSGVLQASSQSSYSGLSTKDSAKLLASAIQQSRSLGDKRAEAYALKSLGGLYEETRQWSEAQDLTQQGLALAQSSNAPEITYTLEWQLGRLLWAQKDINGAIAAYDAAVDTLKSLRFDLAALNQDVQFNFRDSVEPIYRESVELLLQSQQGKTDEKILEKVRQRIEALQLAQLDNLFQKVYLRDQKVALDMIVDRDEPTSAIFYTFILPKELQVIVKIPKQPLRHYSTKISQAEIEKIIVELRKNLVNPTATQAIKAQSQQIYNWLIKPIESELKQQGINTLVFQVDGPLANIPMSVLYNGEQYLVEKYSVASTTGLYLLYPSTRRYLINSQIKVLLAGLTKPPVGFSNFPPIPAVESELNKIASIVPSRLLLNENFTRSNLKKLVNLMQFSVIHLATYGQFSSRAEDTFVLASDGFINLQDFNNILRPNDSQKFSTIELLVLGASQTAAGDSRATLGLAGASVISGARSTLASLWFIDDKATELLMNRFYREWVTNEATKAEALRRAQVSLLRDPRYNSPAFWASFVLLGDWR
ncbi:CHAT domain-containing protein [Nostoc sp. ChiQUE01b]|uniref:CHAT domain-containing protein n=1 Tax=Nostoc sp. ChiQUE01b TaxID=3075376 RepID=UPI002AD34D56|nr:CHAT domain-containing protein [Nostoc sp. ChiQUE01b]MDZ8264433.1 CHAT domain-containing protein [Nostoc sp. ChiQUE01b]